MAGLLNLALAGQQPVLFETVSFAGKTIEHVLSSTSGGHISTTGVGDSANYKVDVMVSNPSGTDLSHDDIQTRIDNYYNLTVELRETTLLATARRKDGVTDVPRDQQLSFGFVLEVPVSVSTDLSTSGGNVALKNVTFNTHKMSTSGGNLVVQGVTGHITGLTSGGSVSVTDSMDSRNVVDMSTSGGNVLVNHCQGQVTVKTSGGNIKLNDMEGTIDARTSGGNIKADHITGNATLRTSGGSVDCFAISGGLTASTTGGKISANMTKVASATDLKTSGGGVDLTFPSGSYNVTFSGTKVETNGLSNFNGTTQRKLVKGTVNGGGVPISAKGMKVTVTMLELAADAGGGNGANVDNYYIEI